MDSTCSTLANRTFETVGIGGWELDVVTGTLRWSSLTFRIHEVDPGQQPALDFYPPEARPIIAHAVQEAIAHGTPWDLELPFVTARGRRLWVSSTSRSGLVPGRSRRCHPCG